MRKRKPKDNPGTNWLGLALAGGTLTLVVLSVSAAVIWFANRPTAAPARPTSTVVRPTLPPRPRPTTTPFPTPTPPPPPGLNRLPADGYVVYSTNTLEISAIDGDGVRPMRVKGADVAAAPDGEALAYIRDGRLYLYQNEKETGVDVRGTPRMPA
jgi:hypothetical protein